jgi:hypothetical protein
MFLLPSGSGAMPCNEALWEHAGEVKIRGIPRSGDDVPKARLIARARR